MPRTTRELLFLVLCLLGLLVPWYYNLQFMQQHGGFGIADFLAAANANPAASSLSWDVGIACIAFLVWLPGEARRIGMRHWWIFVALAFGIAFAFAFPLFLFLRERRLTDARTSAH